MKTLKSSMCGALRLCALAGLLGLGLRAQASDVQASGGYYGDSGTQNALYVSVHDQAGVISITTQTGHFWGFVTRAEYVSATSARVTAIDYYTLEPLEIDVDTSGAKPVITVIGDSVDASARTLLGRARITL